MRGERKRERGAQISDPDFSGDRIGGEFAIDIGDGGTAVIELSIGDSTDNQTILIDIAIARAGDAPSQGGSYDRRQGS